MVRRSIQELKMQKNHVIPVEQVFGNHTNFSNFVKFKNKSYLFVREVFKKQKGEGITAIEFSADRLDLVGKPRNLYISSRSVPDYVSVISGKQEESPHKLMVNGDRTKFMYYYSLKPAKKSDAKNREVVGIHVFDESLRKLWGAEFTLGGVVA